MENLFRPGKWFVLYCGLFVVLYAVLQYVSNANLKSEAERYATGVFNWYWPGDNWKSKANVVDVSVVNRNEHDATVKVKGHQELGVVGQHGVVEGAPETADCTATLTLYKRSTDKGVVWELGEVQFN